MGRLYSTHADHIREDALHYPECHDRGEANPERLFQGRDRSAPALVPEADRPPDRAPRSASVQGVQRALLMQVHSLQHAEPKLSVKPQSLFQDSELSRIIQEHPRIKPDLEQTHRSPALSKASLPIAKLPNPKVHPLPGELSQHTFFHIGLKCCGQQKPARPMGNLISAMDRNLLHGIHIPIPERTQEAPKSLVSR